jgi:hypothetical protein
MQTALESSVPQIAQQSTTTGQTEPFQPPRDSENVAEEHRPTSNGPGRKAGMAAQAWFTPLDCSAGLIQYRRPAIRVGSESQSATKGGRNAAHV